MREYNVKTWFLDIPGINVLCLEELRIWQLFLYCPSIYNENIWLTSIFNKMTLTPLS